jgi:hypothetical protein
LSQTKYAKGLMDSDIYHSAASLQTSQRVIYDLGNKKSGVWNIWLFALVEIVPKEK